MNYQQTIRTFSDKLNEADAVLVGASNGLSISEGFNIFADDAWFQQHFGDFRRRFGIKSVLQGYFYPFAEPEQHWAFIGRLAKLKRLQESPSPMMRNLKKLVQNRPHFVLTSNTEDHFTLAGFAPENIFEIEGKITQAHCAGHCGDEVADITPELNAMRDLTSNTAIPAECVPKCRHCGGHMTVNIGHDQRFFATSHWQAKQRDLQAFLQRWHGKKLLVLEFGIGRRNQLIKAPLMNLVAAEPNADYVTFNKGELYIPAVIADQSVGVDGDIAAALEEIVNRLN